MNILRSLRAFRERKRQQGGSYAYMFEPYHGDEVVSLDCETTSLDVGKGEILAIGAVKIKGRRVKTSERLDIKLKPPQHMPADAVKVHQLRSVDLAEGVSIEEALDQVLAFIGNRPILGYYVDYDIRMLDKFLQPYVGFRLPNKAIELSHVYHDIVKWKSVGGDVDLRFDTIASKLDLPILKRHTALGDAITVALMYVRLKYGENPTP